MISYARKVYAVYHWLLQNAVVQSPADKVNRANLKDTAHHYVVTLKDKIHDAKIYNGGYEGYTNTTFCIRVGSPKFRGSVNYKLPSHSLVFDSGVPATVKILLSGDLNPVSKGDVFWNTNKIQMNVNEHWWENRFRSVAVHPHISTHGEPCLGNWSQAWSTCIATSNLISLINVTQGFLNTWTSYDSFWNINNLRRIWLRFPVEIRKLYTLSDFLVLRNIWQDIEHRISTTISTGNAKFVDWVNQNINEVTAYLEMCNFKEDCMVNLHMYWNGATLSKKHIPDTQDRKLSTLEDVYNMIYNTYSGVADKLVDEFNLYENYSYSLATDIMTNRVNWACVNPQKAVRENDSSPPTRVLSQINSSMQSNLRHRSSSSAMLTFTDIFEYQRTCRRRKQCYLTTSYVRDVDMYHEFRSEHCRRNTRNAYWNVINMVIRYFNTFRNDNEDLIEYINKEDIKEDEDIDTIFDALINARVTYQDSSSIEPDERIAHYLNAALERYDLLINEYKQRSIENGKEKYICLPDRDRGENPSQNPVPVESF